MSRVIYQYDGTTLTYHFHEGQWGNFEHDTLTAATQTAIDILISSSKKVLYCSPRISVAKYRIFMCLIC